MIDLQTQQEIRVSTDGNAGPYLMVPVVQLPQVLASLDLHKIRYWVDSNAVSLDGKPAIVVINFGRNGNAESVQNILDESA